MKAELRRPLVGLATVLSIAVIVALAVVQFRGGFTPTASVTVLSDRAGLMMYPHAKVQMQGVQIGKVSSLRELPGGGAEMTLALDPMQLDTIPSNVLVNVSATTVSGAKVVQFVSRAVSEFDR